MPESPFYRSSPIRPATPTTPLRPASGNKAPVEPNTTPRVPTPARTSSPDTPPLSGHALTGARPPSGTRPMVGAVSTASQSIEALRRKALGVAGSRVAPPPPKKAAPKPAKVATSRTPARRATPAELARRHELARSRAQLIERLTNPLLTLQETSLLLNVCPATVRRWANAGQLAHVRTEGNQRRFRWHDVQLLMPEAVVRRRN